MTYTVLYSHLKQKCVLLWRPFFVEAPGQLPSLPSPKSGAGQEAERPLGAHTATTG